MDNNPQTVVMQFDIGMVNIACQALLSTARCDTPAAFAEALTNHSNFSTAFLEQVEQDDAGRRLLRAKGPAYLGAAVGIILMNMFSAVPKEKRPVCENGHPLDAASMADTILATARKFLESYAEDRPEGPKRTLHVVD